MKLCVVSQYFPPDTGGASTRSSNLICSLMRKGHEVTVVTAFPHYPEGKIPLKYRLKLISLESYGSARVLRVWVPPIAHEGIIKRLIMYTSFAFSALMALPFCRGNRVVWAMSPNYLCMIPALALKIAESNSKIIHDVVDIWPGALLAAGYSFPRGILGIAGFLARVSYVFSDAIVTLSASMRRTLLKTTSKSIKINVMENVVGESFLRMSPGVRDNGFHIMYLGTLSPSNDFPTLVEAASKLESDNDLRFTIAGAGELAGSIKRSLKEKNIKNVDFREGPINHDEVPKWLDEADALVLPLRSGFGDTSFPSKLGEYLASGRPVVCMADGSLAATLRANDLCLLVPPGDAEGLVRAFGRLRNEPSLCHELCSKGREYSKLHLSPASFEDKVEKILEIAEQTI